MNITLTWGAFQTICKLQGIRLIYALSTGKVQKIVSLEELYTGLYWTISPLSVTEAGFLAVYPGATKVDDIT